MSVSKKSKTWGIGIILTITLFIVFKQDLVIKPIHYFKSLSADIETIQIKIANERFQILDSLRNDVLQNQKVKPKHKQYVKAKAFYKNDTIKIKLRLKGDQLDHYESNPPSYRVKTKGNKTILGTNKFSLQFFGARNFAEEWVFQKLLEQQDVISIRSDVVEVIVNGEKTIRTFEEHFTHFLTDRFNRERGPIICISEDLFWNHGRLNDSVKYKDEQEIFLKAPIKTFKSSVALDISLIKIAESLLDDYRNQRKNTEEVFDIEKLAIHFAASDLANTHHGLRWHNRRYYFNPSSKKLEPIGFDGCSWGPITNFAFEDDFLKSLKWTNLRTNKAFIESYLTQLERMSDPSFLDEFFMRNEDEIVELEKRIYKEKIFYANDYQSMYRNASWIRANIEGYKNRLLKNLGN